MPRCESCPTKCPASRTCWTRKCFESSSCPREPSCVGCPARRGRHSDSPAPCATRRLRRSRSRPPLPPTSGRRVCSSRAGADSTARLGRLCTPCRLPSRQRADSARLGPGLFATSRFLHKTKQQRRLVILYIRRRFQAGMSNQMSILLCTCFLRA